MVSIDQLKTLKSEIVSQLMALISPHMEDHADTPAGSSRLRRIWVKRDQEGRRELISFEGSNMQPVYGITQEGIVQNCYGNAVVRNWDDVNIEDVVRLNNLAQTQLA
jgi:hypothetical protein